MIKKLSIICFVLFCTAVYAQDCYNTTRSQGISLFNQGKKAKAKEYFVSAKTCPDKPSNNDLDAWIKKCEGDKSNTTNEASLEILGVELVNISSGNNTVAGQSIYFEDMKLMAPRIEFRGQVKKNKVVTIYAKLIDPDGDILENESSPRGYTSKQEVTAEPNKDNVTYMPSLSSYRTKFDPGVYSYQVWHQNSLVFTRTFVVSGTPAITTLSLTVNNRTSDISTLDIPYTGSSETYTVSTNAPSYDISAPDWCVITEKNSDHFKVTFKDNPNRHDRNDFIIVSAMGHTVYVKISQNPNPNVKNKALSSFSSSKDSKSNTSDKPYSLDAGIGLLVTSTSVSFGDATVQSVINYGVNDLQSAQTDPDYKAGIGLNLHLNVRYFINDNIALSSGLALSLNKYSNNFKSDNWQFNTNNGTVTNYPTQKSEESYKFTFLEIPVLFNYIIPFGNNYNLFLKAGPVFNIGLAGKVSIDGTIYSESTDGYYTNSTLTGDANLYSGEYNFSQSYTTGAANTYDIHDYATNPYNRFNLAFRLGADVEIDKFIIGLSYSLGVTNIANSSYWQNPYSQIPGFYRVGAPLFHDDTNPLYNYKQRLNNINISIGYKF